MRVRVLLLFACAAGWTSVARADAPSGFDHNLHERDIFTHGGDALACASCHPIQNGVLVGRPAHSACFGKCHGAPPATQFKTGKPLKAGAKLILSEEQQRVCVNCHAASTLHAPLTKRPTVAYPPYPSTDFSLASNHKSHAAFACTTCHPAMNGVSAPRTAPHRRCLGCHDGAAASGKGFAMTTCQPCHTPGSGTPLPTRLAEPNDTVTSVFSHPKHAVRGGKGAQCVTCHAAISETNQFILPRTKAADCATSGCHDGAPVFPITEACTRCHTTAPTKYTIKRLATRFSHATHETTGLACTACHIASKTNEVATVGHAVCVSCHADDFSARFPRLCSACHNSTEPWRKLTADRSPADRTEFGAAIDHSVPAHQTACAACHSLTTLGSQLRPARGHSACAAAGCHTTTGSVTPRLTACESCHQRGLMANRTAQRIAAAWSVRATFQHAAHTKTAEGANLPCGSCHTDMTAPTIGQLSTPEKKTCQPCHDGAAAFKLTGTTCTRCHLGVSNVRL